MVLLVAAGGFLLYASTLTAKRDTIAFWAAGHLLLHHQNPYDETAMFELQRSAGFVEARPQMVRNPPFALWIALPLGGLSPFTAGMAWTLMTVLSLFASIRLLRPLLDVHQPRLLLTSYLFAPAVACVQLGQYGTVVALGVIAFLSWQRSRPFLAGASLVLAGLKPHLLLPFAAVVACWIVTERAYRVAAGAAMALGIATAVAMVFKPGIWGDYLPILAAANADMPRVPTLAAAISAVLGSPIPWFPYVPAMLACVWAVWYFASRSTWDWARDGLLPIVVSMWVAPYSWVSDQMVLLPAIASVLARRPRSLASFAVLNLFALIPLLMVIDSLSPVYAWISSGWLIWYLLWTRAGRETASSPTARDFRVQRG